MCGLFPCRPTDEIIRNNLEHIKATGEPHTWPNHTNDRPQRHARVVYLAEYDLPSSHHMPDKWAHCPICSPDKPKYYKGGKMAWFPDEGIIRNIGGDCYASLVGKEEHQAAEAQFRREQQERRDAAFVAMQLPKMVAALPVIEENLALAQAIDDFRGRLLPGIGDRLLGRLWGHLRGSSGELRTIADVVERRFVDGRTVERETQQETRYASLSGYRILEPPPYEQLAPRLREAIERLRALLLGNDPLVDLDPEAKSRAIRRVTVLWDAIRERVAIVHEWRSFVDVVNMRTLRTWGAHPQTPVRAAFDLKGDTFMVGEFNEQPRSVRIPAVMLAEPPSIPPLGGQS